MVVFLQSILTQDLDIAYSGNYLIRNCNAGQPGSYAEQLQNLLPLIRNTLQDVIADAFLGTASSHGFATFFRSNDNIAYVQRLYRLISQGPSAPLPEADSGTPMPRFTSGQPTIICVQPNGESDDHHGDIEWLITQCASEETHFFFAGLVKGEQGDRYIMLCPRFWDSSELGTVALHRECPKVRRNTLTPWGIELALNWHHILVEEMVHLYGAVGHEEYAINDVANVPDADVLNAGSNWAYYYSGEVPPIPDVSRSLSTNLFCETDG